jgi:hypothetical protein
VHLGEGNLAHYVKVLRRCRARALSLRFSAGVAIGSRDNMRYDIQYQTYPCASVMTLWYKQ